METIQEKSCITCGIPIIGRVDKRFCSDQCRNTFNNRLNRDGLLYVRNTNNALKRNRRILSELSSEGMKRISRSRLLSMGFDFRLLTSIDETRSGGLRYYCYEHGYQPIENDCFLLVIKKEVLK